MGALIYVPEEIVVHKYSKRDARRPGTGSGSGEEVWKSERKRRLLGFCLGRISADRLEICMQRVLRGNERNWRRRGILYVFRKTDRYDIFKVQGPINI